MLSERRKTQRQRVLQGASAVFNGRQSVLDCTIRNWSDTGALLRMTDWIALPPVFDIDVPSKGKSLRVRLCWRRGDDVGVVFLKPDECRPQEPIQLDLARKLRQCEQDNARLKARIGQLTEAG